MKKIMMLLAVFSLLATGAFALQQGTASQTGTQTQQTQQTETKKTTKKSKKSEKKEEKKEEKK